MECYMFLAQGQKSIPPERLSRVAELIEPWFLFALIWTVGGTCDNDGRNKFDSFVREKTHELEVSDTLSLIQLVIVIWLSAISTY